MRRALKRVWWRFRAARRQRHELREVKGAIRWPHEMFNYWPGLEKATRVGWSETLKRPVYGVPDGYVGKQEQVVERDGYTYRLKFHDGQVFAYDGIRESESPERDQDTLGGGIVSP